MKPKEIPAYTEYMSLEQVKPKVNVLCIVTDGEGAYYAAEWNSAYEAFETRRNILAKRFKYWLPVSKANNLK